ncbi:MAG: hypothetical protein INR72_19920 [Williamsia herbipolensis]|nr:hypothetical protein [Williamsia herbipolensis]
MSVRRRWLLITLIALAGVASGTTSYVVGEWYDGRRGAEVASPPNPRPEPGPSLGLGVRPSVLWTLDRRALAPAPGQELLTIPGLGSGTVGGKAVDTPTHLVVAVGRSPFTG